jgi:hypothetical protein
MWYHIFDGRHTGTRGKRMAKVKFILLLPLTYNDKSQVPKAVRQQIFADIFRLAEGHHIAGVGKGTYRMKSGAKQVDRCAEVWIVIDEQDEAALKAMVAGFGKLLGQEAMYLERVSSTIEFVPPLAEGE